MRLNKLHPADAPVCGSPACNALDIGVSDTQEIAVIISHKYKFIFIKTLKTAGTSIEVYLSQHCGEEDSVTPIWPHVAPHHARNYEENNFFNHIPALDIKNRISREIWNSYFKFCVERNPWDKTLSHYHMLNDRAGGNISFEAYIRSGNFCINWPKYCDSSGFLMVDKVIKYEGLMDNLRQVFQKLGIPFDGSLGVNAKSEHRKDRRPYQELFTAEQKEIIESAFAKEIKMHGYIY